MHGAPNGFTRVSVASRLKRLSSLNESGVSFVQKFCHPNMLSDVT